MKLLLVCYYNDKLFLYAQVLNSILTSPSFRTVIGLRGAQIRILGMSIIYYAHDIMLY